MNPSLRCRSALLLVLLSAPLVARSADPRSSLRWADVAGLVPSLPAVREADARVEGAAAGVSTAGSVPNPTVSVSAGDAESRNGPDRRREWSVAVEVPLDLLATRGPRVAAARASERAAAVEAQIARAQALRVARREFIALAHGQAALEAQLELEAQVARLASLVRTRAERGEARPTEVPRVELELERLRTSVVRARSSADALRARLSSTLGAPVGRVEADLERSLVPPSREDLDARLVSTTPAVDAARARVTAASEDARAERRERVPKVSVGAGHVEELDRRATTLTATVTVPLWNWHGGRVRQAEANVRAEQARLDAVTREARATASDAWHACVAGQESSRRFRGEVLPRAEGSARTMGRAFELGEATLLDVIDTRRVLLDARREYLDLLLEMQNACGELAALAGLELP